MHWRPPAIEALLRTAYGPFTSTAYEYKTFKPFCCDGEHNMQPGLTAEGRPCHSECHDKYWELYRQARPARFTELLRRLVGAWTSKAVGFEIEEKTLGMGCCDGSLDNPGLTPEGGACRRSPHHDTYWNLYDQLKDNNLL